MKDIEEIRGRCVVTEDGHWLWRGSLRPDGRPNIWAPDFTKGGMTVQSGPRAVWHCITEAPIPANWRAYGTCSEPTCCNPAHVKCTSEVDFGKWLARTGKFKGKTRRILANRAIGRALARRLNLLETIVSRARRGEITAFQGVGMFSGLVKEGSHA